MSSITGKYNVKDIEAKKALSELERSLGNSALSYTDNIKKDKLNDVAESGFHFDEKNMKMVFRKGNKLFKFTVEDF